MISDHQASFYDTNYTAAGTFVQDSGLPYQLPALNTISQYLSHSKLFRDEVVTIL